MSTTVVSTPNVPELEPAPIVKRSVVVAGHRTSISIEEPFWRAAKGLAAADGISISSLLAQIDRNRPPGASLSSAVRLHVLRKYQKAASSDPR
jgi:predicted DNA-binding ribbon-helix-helix protein